MFVVIAKIPKIEIWSKNTEVFLNFKKYIYYYLVILIRFVKKTESLMAKIKPK